MFPFFLLQGEGAPAGGASDAAGAEEGGGPSLFDPQILMMFLLMYLVFYFLLIRPQKKQQAEHQRLVDSLKKGDTVQTSSGIVGTVVSVDKENDRVEVLVDEKAKVKLTFVRSAVTAVVRDQEATANETSTSADASSDSQKKKGALPSG
ncbi:MAG: preprotein translocase subunit YajC [Patescibacteria group bacterium]